MGKSRMALNCASLKFEVVGDKIILSQLSDYIKELAKTDSIAVTSISVKKCDSSAFDVADLITGVVIESPEVKEEDVKKVEDPVSDYIDPEDIS